MKTVNMTKETAEAFRNIVEWAKAYWPPHEVHKDYICKDRYWMKDGKKVKAKAMRVKYTTTVGRLRWKRELIECIRSLTPTKGEE